MSWSRAEISALATKAARGAGAPAGQAAGFGAAAVVHLVRQRDEQALIDALDALPVGPVVDLPCQIDAALSGDAPIANDAVSDLLKSYLEARPYPVSLDHATGCLSVNDGSPASGISGRITGYSELIDLMEKLAERTYVPDSDASRAAGAGAGLSDND